MNERLPIVATHRVQMSDDDRRCIRNLAVTLVQEDPNLSGFAYFSKNAKTGFGNSSAILIGDNSEIPLLAPAGENTLEYRIAMLAREDDLVVIATQKTPAFESYMSRLLGLSFLNTIQARQPIAGPPLSTARRCLADPELLQTLVAHVRSHQGITIIPHISTGSIWMLAKRLHELTKMPIHVAAPPPGLANRVNNKLWFADTVVRLLGRSAIPPKRTAFGPAALTGHVQRLACKWDKLVVKVPDSAGSEGNFPIISKQVRGLGARALHDYLMRMLSLAHGSSSYPLMVEVWDCNVIGSPSVQTWIPDAQEGEPVIEGIFDQHLFGEEGEFVGAAPARLPPVWKDHLCRDAVKLALLFQQLGYFGRCSFDSVIAGADYNNAALHWIECNGRWGGVSLPMTFMNRIFEVNKMPAYVIVQRSDIQQPDQSFSEVLTQLDSYLYEPGSEPTGIIFSSPCGCDSTNDINMIVLDGTMEMATRRADRAIKCFGGAVTI